MSDPVTYTICDPTVVIPCPPLGVPQTLGLNSTYDITYGGPRLGIRVTNQVSDQVAFFGSVSYGMIAASATGFWNLRNLTFRHVGNGTAAVIEGAIGWTPSENWMVRLGYTYATISATGRETFFCIPAGFCGDPNLNWDAKTTNQGVTLAGTYQW